MHWEGAWRGCLCDALGGGLRGFAGTPLRLSTGGREPLRLQRGLIECSPNQCRGMPAAATDSLVLRNWSHICVNQSPCAADLHVKHRLLCLDCLSIEGRDPLRLERGLMDQCRGLPAAATDSLGPQQLATYVE